MLFNHNILFLVSYLVSTILKSNNLYYVFNGSNNFKFQALYLDAVKFLPEELPEVQDLLIEKELRLHTTPEEIEVLRE